MRIGLGPDELQQSFHLARNPYQLPNAPNHFSSKQHGSLLLITSCHNLLISSRRFNQLVELFV